LPNPRVGVGRLDAEPQPNTSHKRPSQTLGLAWAESTPWSSTSALSDLTPSL